MATGHTKKDGIKFVAAIQKLQTLADGGIRLTLDLPEDAILQMAQLAECKRVGVAGEVTYRPVTEIFGMGQTVTP